MEQWHKTGCVLCAQNCGLEVMVKDGRMVKVKPDKDNPRSQGYACRKGLSVVYHQYPNERITEPLKRVGNNFEPISWDLAIDEIATKLRQLLDKHGPRCLAYMGASAQGGHFEAAFGLRLLKALGSQYLYSSVAQEFSGFWWVVGRMFGKQYNIPVPDEHNSEMLVAWGWNGMESHQTPRAPIVLTEFSKNPNRMLIVIDPRKSETASIADIHLPIRPGTDSLLMKAMISIILDAGWEKKDYIANNLKDFENIRSWFANFDIKAALDVCQLDHDKVYELCHLMITKRWCFHPDLGIYMSRHSALNSYLMNILGAICGIFGTLGGNIIPGMVMPLGSHADERDPKVWRTVVTNMPPVAAGSFPPSVMPEEIMTDNPDRLRAVLVSACNPLRSYPDTTAYEKAFDKLDLLVVNEIVMSETARLAHYVLPCRTYYESWDGTFFPFTYPGVYFQMRRPIVKPSEHCLESSQIFTLLADKLGIIPKFPDELVKAAQGDRMMFGAKLMEWAMSEPTAMPNMPFVLAKTLGKAWDSANLAALWGMLMTAPKSFRKNAVNAGFPSGMEQGDCVFQALLDNPQGLWVGKADVNNPMDGIKTPSGKIEVYIPEMEKELKSLNAATEAESLKLPDNFPLILSAGRHLKYNANTLMRNPEWNKGKRACTVAINPEDAQNLNLKDTQQVRVTTEAGTQVGELEVTAQVRKGTVLIPHGFGLIYDGKKYGLNVNYLTKNTNRDFLGTPMHRFIPCRVEAA